MTPDVFTGIAGTVVLWAVSAAIALGLGLALMAGSLTPRRGIRLAARAAVHVTRGVPTALWVIAAGVAMLHVSAPGGLPVLFPGTLQGFQPLALAVALALALGSAGHLAEIFRAARGAISPARLEQATLLGLSRPRSAALVARECAAVALPPTASRLVHLLHNTAFAALFPVTELFGYVQGRANQTFRVEEYVLLGALVYVILSAAIWLGARLAEGRLAPHRAQAPATSMGIA